MRWGLAGTSSGKLQKESCAFVAEPAAHLHPRTTSLQRHSRADAFSQNKNNVALQAVVNIVIQKFCLILMKSQ